MSRLLVYALLGPAVGAAVILLTYRIFLLDGTEPELGENARALALGIFLVAVYPIGLLPALATGWVDGRLLRRGMQAAGRIPAVIGTGALLGAPAGMIPGPQMLLTAVAGACAAAACAIVAARFPPAA